MIRAALALLLAAATGASAQTAADGWSGRVECVLSARGIGYQDDQTHTWVLSGPPVARNDVRVYPAAWTASGRGSRTPIAARAAGAGAGDSWTHGGSNPGSSITLFVPVNTTTIRIAAGQRAVKAVAGLKGTGAEGAFSGDLDEWRFQYIDVPNGAVQTSLSGSRTQTRGDQIGWRPPPGSTVTETCSWNLTKSGSASTAGADARGAAASAGASGGAAGAAAAGTASLSASSSAGAAARGDTAAGGAAGAAGAGAAGDTRASATSNGGAATEAAGGAAAGGAAGAAGAGARGAAGASAGASAGSTTTATSIADISRQYAAIGRTPTAGTGVVFATLADASGAPLIGVPITDVHLVNAAAQPIGLGAYVVGPVGDIVDNSSLGVTFEFNGSSRVAFLDVPVGAFTLSVNVFVAGSVQTRTVQGTSAAGVITSVQLGSSAAASSSSATGSGGTGAAGGGRTTTTTVDRSRLSTSAPDIRRQYAVINRTPTAGTGVVYATLVDAAGAPLVGVPLANIHLTDAASQPVGLGPYVFGAAGDIVDGSTLSITTPFDGRSRVAFLDVPVGRFTLTVSFSSGGKVVTRSAQVVTTAGQITVAQP